MNAQDRLTSPEPDQSLAKQTKTATSAGFVAFALQFREALGDNRASLGLNALVLRFRFLSINLSLQSAHMFASAMAIDVIGAGAGSNIAVLVNEEVIIDVFVGEGGAFVNEFVSDACNELSVHVV